MLQAPERPILERPILHGTDEFFVGPVEQAILRELDHQDTLDALRAARSRIQRRRP